MTEYERGQRDMRNRIEKLFSGYDFGDSLALAMKRPKGIVTGVPVHIRRICKVVPVDKPVERVEK